MQSVSLDVSVTAICCLKKLQGLVLVGLGNKLELYESGQLTSSRHIFISTSSSIHGFIESPFPCESATRILIFGSKNICILELSLAGKLRQSKCTEIQCEDWVFAARWMAESDALVLTAHNRVLKLKFEGESRLVLSSRVIQCKEKCILYSGQIEEDCDCVFEASVLAGTVFRELIIWSIPKEANDYQNEVLHRLSGHDGVIFSVKFCPKTSTICTTSDDRTARLWKVEWCNFKSPNWKSAKISCHQVLSSFHTSRIFSSVFFDSTIVTVGEDSAFCRWAIEDGKKISWKRSAHDGSPLWSADIDPQFGFLYTGGGDGSIKSWPFDGLSLETTTQLKFPNEFEPDSPRILLQFYSQFLLCLTTRGTLLAFSACENNKMCQVIMSDDELSSYALMEILNEKQLVLATLDGKIKIWNLTFETDQKIQCCCVTQQKIHDGKIFSMAVLPNNQVLTCAKNGDMKITSIINDKMLIRHSLILPESKEQRWFSCATTVTKQGLAVGDRCGNTHIYNLSSNSENPVKSFYKLHGRFGIGCIKFDNGIVSTAGRDGIIQTLQVGENFFDKSESCDIQRSGSVRLKFAWLEKIVEFHGKTFVLGFHSDRFVVFNLSDGCVACEMSCGGSHRSWTFGLDDNFLTFTFIKEKTVEQFRISTINLLGTRAMRSPHHILEINCVTKFEIGAKTFLMTGSEDNKIKIFEFDNHLVNQDAFEDQTVNRCVATLNSHISSVKCLQVVTVSGSVYIISAGSRAQLKIWRASLSSNGSLIAAELASNLLKGDDKKRKKTWRDQELINDAETRYMDVLCFENERKLVLDIVLACSDAVLRKFRYDISQVRLKLLSETDPPESNAFIRAQKCIDKNYFDQTNVDFVTSSTNGKVIFWNKERMTKLREMSVHNSGINSMIWLDQGALITGGDDGAMGYVSFPGFSSILKDCANSGHITGIAVLDNCHVLTCSVDQRVSLWKISQTANPFELVCQKFSHVPDLHDIVVVDHRHVVVVGAGMQIFKINYKC